MVTSTAGTDTISLYSSPIPNHGTLRREDLRKLERIMVSADLLAKLSTFFETDLAFIQFRRIPPGKECGTLAFAIRDTVYLTTMALSMDSDYLHQLLVHEITHCLQQRAGRVSGQPYELVNDPQLEQEADQMAALWSLGETPRTSQRRAAIVQRLRPSDRPSPPVAQPVVMMVARADNKSPEILREFSKKSEAAELWASMMNLDRSAAVLNGLTVQQKDAAKKKLKHWVTAPKHRRFISIGKKGHWKQFRDREELARALAGRVSSRDSKAIEHQLARAVAKSDWVKRTLKEVVRSLNDYMDTMRRFRLSSSSENDRWTMMDVAVGQLDHSIDRSDNPGWSYQNTADYFFAKGEQDEDFFENLVHDVYDNQFGGCGRYAYFYSPMRSAIKSSNTRTHKQAIRYLLREDVPSYKTAAFLCDIAMVMRHLIPESLIPYHIEFESSRATHFNVDESTEWVKRARAANIRLGAGPSATTMQVLRIVKYLCIWQREGVVTPDSNFTDRDRDIVKAVALALFEFWNSHANQKKAEIHTYHEVMIVAHGFGCDLETSDSDGSTRSLAEFEYPDLGSIPA